MTPRSIFVDYRADVHTFFQEVANAAGFYFFHQQAREGVADEFVSTLAQ